MKERIESIPGIGSLARNSYRAALGMLDWASGARRRLATIERPYAKKVIHVLERLEDSACHEERDLAFRIEEMRRQMLLCDDPVNDGTLADERVYDQDLTIRNACLVSKRPTEAMFLYYLAREFQPTNAVELGTNVGITSAYQAAALRTYEPNGRLTTFEFSPYRLRLAQEVHRKLSLENVTYVQGLFRDTLGDGLRGLGSIEYAYIDGDHDYQSTLDYFYMITNYLTEDAVMVFDDIRWSRGMQQAWGEILADPRVALAVDLHSMGICIIGQASSAERVANAPLTIRNALKVDFRRCSGIESYYEGSRQLKRTF